MNNTYQDEMKNLYVEDFIWCIYFFIIAFNLYSNYLEEKYIKYKNINDRKKFRKINKYVFIIVFIIYLYFFYINYNRLNKISINTSSRQKKIIYLSIIISILFVIAGALSIYISFENEILDDEIGII